MGCAQSVAADVHVEEVQDSSPVNDFHAEYLVFHKLGSGAFGSVYSAAKVGQDVPKFAVKVVDLREEESVKLGLWGATARLEQRRMSSNRHEVSTLRKVACHENVCKIFTKFVQGGLAYIVLERCDRTLYKSLERRTTLDESTLCQYFVGMLKGLNFVHLRGIVHRDIKPSNFMCSGIEDTVKLCDFGLARSLPTHGAETLSGVCGTAPFMSPELLNGCCYGAKVDTWAMGCAAYSLCFGRFPYSPLRNTSKEMKRAIQANFPAPTFSPANSEGPGSISAPLVSWLRKLLNRDPALRMCSSEALYDEALNAGGASSSSNLRPMLLAAKRAGAFGGEEDEASVSTVDIRLQELHNKRHPGKALAAKLALPPSEESTEIGSSPWNSR